MGQGSRSVGRQALGMGLRAMGVGLSLTLLGSVAANAADRDRDGLRDLFEQRWGVTSPDRRDSDADGVVDPAEDSDGDRLSNLGEQRFGTDPGAPDSDGDGKPDGAEDSDRDGLSNAREQDRRAIPRGLRPTLARAAGDRPSLPSRCFVAYRESRARRCVTGATGSLTSVVIFGDSHALMWVPGLARAGARQGWRIETLLKAGCPSVDVRPIGQHRIDGGRTCRAWRRNAYRWLQGRRPDLIIITNTDAYQLITAAGRSPGSYKRRQLWKHGLERTLAAMPRSSRVVVLGDTPKNSRDPVRCLRRHRANMSACATRRVGLAGRRYHKVERTAARAAGAQFATLDAKVCSYDPCPLVQGDILIWRDRGHMTATFSRQLAPALTAVVRRALQQDSAIVDRSHGEE